MTTILALPDDILLEILACLPALSIALVCRRICHKMDRLSRELHLWIKVFNSTKHLLPQLIVGDLGGSPKLERAICRAEILERMWADEDALRTPPRYQRYSLSSKTWRRGTPVAIMEGYVVFWDINAYGEEQRYKWVAAHDWNGPVVFQINTAMTFPCIGSYMDLDTGTLYIPFPSEQGLEVVGFRVDTQVDQIVEVVRYALPTRRRGVRYLEPNNGFLCLHYGSPIDNPKIEVGVVDLKRGVLFQFSLTHLASLLPQDRIYPMLNNPRVFSTETHLIFVTGMTVFSIFERPTNDQDIRALSSNATLPTQEATLLTPILTGRFPQRFHKVQVMSRSATSFVIVGMGEVFSPASAGRQSTIRAFYFDVSNGEPSFEEVCSLEIPGLLTNFVLRSPPSTARYALGVLTCNRGGVGEVAPNWGKRGYFTLRIDLPDSERGSKSENQCKMTLTKMQLVPAVDEEAEVAEFQYFNHFSGKVILFAFSKTAVRTDVLLDYLVE